MLLKDYIADCRLRLSGIYPYEEAGALVNIICTECLGTESYTHIVNPGFEVKDKQMAKAEEAMKRLLNHEPIQYVLGFAEFCGRRFNVNPSVLIPRPETESLCNVATEAAMMIFRNRSAYGKDASPVKILDLCTGSGCLAWTLALSVPGAIVTAVDISEDALDVAQTQPFEIEKKRRPKFVRADIFDDEAVTDALGNSPCFDMIVSNPPYVLESERKDMRRNVLDFEPELALFVPDDDCLKFYGKIAEISKKLLYTDSNGFVEINSAKSIESEALFEENGFPDVETIKDIFGRPRIVKYRK